MADAVACSSIGDEGRAPYLSSYGSNQRERCQSLSCGFLAEATHRDMEIGAVMSRTSAFNDVDQTDMTHQEKSQFFLHFAFSHCARVHMPAYVRGEKCQYVHTVAMMTIATI